MSFLKIFRSSCKKDDVVQQLINTKETDFCFEICNFFLKKWVFELISIVKVLFPFFKSDTFENNKSFVPVVVQNYNNNLILEKKFFCQFQLLVKDYYSTVVGLVFLGIGTAALLVASFSGSILFIFSISCLFTQLLFSLLISYRSSKICHE